MSEPDTDGLSHDAPLLTFDQWIEQNGNQVELFIALHESVTHHDVARRFGLHQLSALGIVESMCHAGRLFRTRHGLVGWRYWLKVRGACPGVDIDAVHRNPKWTQA